MAKDKRHPKHTTSPATQAEKNGAILRLVGGTATAPGLVRIDGLTYEMADALHFSLREAGAYQAAVGRIMELETKAIEGEADADDDREYRQRLEEVARLIAPSAPAEKWAALATGELSDLAVAFFALAAMRNPRLQMAASMVARSKPTGTTSSRSSRASTRHRRPAAATG
jgi:hypothetical protein